MRGVQGKFEKAYSKPVPRITPHVLRHTFCTNVQQAGLDVKSLQYLMGHSNASVTLDVYTHSSFESVERAFEQIAGNLLFSTHEAELLTPKLTPKLTPITR